jgi:hypothetical protein
VGATFVTQHLVPWLDQQLENQRRTGQALHLIASTMPHEAAQMMKRIGDFLTADAESKRRIIAAHRIEGGVCDQCFSPEVGSGWDEREVDLCDNCTTIRMLAEPLAGEPGYRDEWRPQ